MAREQSVNWPLFSSNHTKLDIVALELKRQFHNPHKLASPFEFFIVVTKPGSYHLDGSYTPFGKVIEGMDVVDKINQVDIDQGEWPMRNVYIEKAVVL